MAPPPPARSIARPLGRSRPAPGKAHCSRPVSPSGLARRPEPFPAERLRAALALRRPGASRAAPECYANFPPPPPHSPGFPAGPGGSAPQGRGGAPEAEDPPSSLLWYLGSGWPRSEGPPLPGPTSPQGRPPAPENLLPPPRATGSPPSPPPQQPPRRRSGGRGQLGPLLQLRGLNPGRGWRNRGFPVDSRAVVRGPSC